MAYYKNSFSGALIHLFPDVHWELTSFNILPRMLLLHFYYTLLLYTFISTLLLFYYLLVFIYFVFADGFWNKEENRKAFFNNLYKNQQLDSWYKVPINKLLSLKVIIIMNNTIIMLLFIN